MRGRPDDADPVAWLQDDDLLEDLAAMEHKRWSSWQAYMHDHCRPGADGSLVIPADLVERWSSQMSTPYENLSEEEKDSDREQVRRYLPTIVAAARAAAIQR